MKPKRKLPPWLEKKQDEDAPPKGAGKNTKAGNKRAAARRVRRKYG